MSCVLRISGERLDVDAMLAATALVPLRHWRRGERRGIASDRRHDDSGAVFAVSDATFDDRSGQIGDAIAFLTTRGGEVSALARWPGVDGAGLDFAFAFESNGFMTSARLPGQLLRRVADAGLDVEVSLYETPGPEAPE